MKISILIVLLLSVIILAGCNINPVVVIVTNKGEIEIEVFINNAFSDYDTIRFDAYIVDRALHKSNTIQTPEIIVNKK